MATEVRERPRILVVDDDAAARATVSGLLLDEYEVEAVDGASAAETALVRARFDVIITDHEMPRTTGMQLLTNLAARHPALVSIIVTGHPNLPEVAAAKQNWRDFTVLIKPYPPRLLLNAVATAVRMSRLRRATLKLGDRTMKSG